MPNASRTRSTSSPSASRDPPPHVRPDPTKAEFASSQQRGPGARRPSPSLQTAGVSAGLVPPETYAAVGEPMGPPVSAVVTRREAQRYARSVGDLDPVYFDEGAARAAGYDGLVAPPTFVGHV